MNVLQPNVSFYHFSPLIGATLIAVSSLGCELTFFDYRAPHLLPLIDGTWSPCGIGSDTIIDDPILVSPSLTESGFLLVTATAQLGAVIFDASLSALRQPLYNTQLPFLPVAGALVLNCSATWVATNGSVAQQSLPQNFCRGTANNQPVLSPPQAHIVESAILCNTTTDVVDKAATALPNGGFIVTSRGGCVTGFTFLGQIAWNTTIPINGSIVAAGIVVDVAESQAYLISKSGLLCCIALGGGGGAVKSQFTNATSSNTTTTPPPLRAGADCAGWGTSCSDLTEIGAILPIRSGLALSPKTTDFHNGQIYATDALGALFMVRTDSGIAGGSSQSGVFKAGSATYAAPALVNQAWGLSKNGLILVSEGGRNRTHAGACASVTKDGKGHTPACVIALEVGSNGNRDDDDARDDDYYATIGRMWAVSLGPNVTANASGLAVHDDGRIFVPTTHGLFVISGRPTSPPSGPNEALLEGIAFGSVAFGVVALGVSLACVARQRRLRKERLWREQDEADADSDAYGLLNAVPEVNEGGENSGDGEGSSASARFAEALIGGTKSSSSTANYTSRRVFALNSIVS